MLARLGYAAIVLEGKPKDDDLYKIFINKDGVKITVDNSLKMLGNYDLVDKDEGGVRRQDRLYLHRSGRGDEDWPRPPSPVTDMELRPTRHAGRGGVGAVMGAKGVKVDRPRRYRA